MRHLIIASLLVTLSLAAVPTAIFHGLGDACHHRGMKEFTEEIAQQTGAYAACIEIGTGSMTSIFENFEKQCESACASLLADPNFQGEFNVLGLSQGGLIARYIVEECATAVPVRNMATLGGPHKGVAATPNCIDGIFCDIINMIVDEFVYFKDI
jgi:palmitoyl-protein thioesterase